MSVTIVKGVTLATFSAGKGAERATKPVSSAAPSAQQLSAQVSVRLASEAAVLSGRGAPDSSVVKIRDYGQAEERADSVAERLREDGELGEEAHANLDGAMPPNGMVV